MFANIIAGALIGGAGGALGGLIAMLLEKLFTRGKPVSDKQHSIGAVAGVMAGIVALNATDLRDRVARVIDPPSPIEAFGLDMLSIPGIQEHIRGKTPQEVQAITRNLSAAGMLKLDDSFLVTRARLVSDMLTKADERFCAGLAAGSLTGDDFMGMIEQLSEEQRNTWFKTIKAAIEAEVGARPPTTQQPPTGEQIQAAMAEILKQLPESEQTRFLSNLGRLAGLAPPEACWTIRQLYSLVGKASGNTQTTLARALIQ